MKRANNLAESFRFAFQGLLYALRTQRNMRLHFFTATLVMVLGWTMQLPRREFIAVLTAIMVVMVAEMVNTAIEAAVDLASPSLHPLAQTAKDVAAGAVLLAAIGALFLGIWVFLPRLSRIAPDFMVRWNHTPGVTVVVLAGLVAVLGLVLWIPKSQRVRRRRPEQSQ